MCDINCYNFDIPTVTKWKEQLGPKNPVIHFFVVIFFLSFWWLTVLCDYYDMKIRLVAGGEITRVPGVHDTSVVLSAVSKIGKIR